MNYFTWLGLVFGLAALLKPVYMHLIPWDENAFIAKAYAEKRPPWIVPVAIIGLGLVALTWYQHFTAGVEYSLILTILFSLTALKAITLIFDYKRFHAWVAGMLTKGKGKKIVLIDIIAGIFGLAIVLLAVLVY
ncbi:MAG: hypothetical protein EA426_15305 [Spirochaetaceae bacterium]|nr:MAG: hypothetical protein EA426_15305 [Spirochaetaceae bacterium]